MSTTIDTENLKSLVAEGVRLEKLCSAAKAKLAEYAIEVERLQPGYEKASANHHHVLGLFELGQLDADALAAAKEELAKADEPLSELGAKRAAVRSQLVSLSAQLQTATETALNAKAVLGTALYNAALPALREQGRAFFAAQRASLLLLEPSGGSRQTAASVWGDPEGPDCIRAVMRSEGMNPDTWGLASENRSTPPLGYGALIDLVDAANAAHATAAPPATNPAPAAQPATVTSKRGK